MDQIPLTTAPLVDIEPISTMLNCTKANQPIMEGKK